MAFLTPDPRHLDRPDAARSGRDRVLPGAASYLAWDGSQAVPDLSADEIVDALADDILEHGDLEEALRSLVQRGLRTGDPTRGDLPGLEDIVERIRRRREELLERGSLADPLADVRAELDEIVAQERAGVRRRLDETDPLRRPSAGTEPDVSGGHRDAPEASPDPADPPGPADAQGAADASKGSATPGPDAGLQRMLRGIADKRLHALDSLPPDVGGRIRGLREYDFLDPGARERFEALLDRLGQSVLDRMAKGLADAVKGLKPEDLDAQRAMVRDLNSLLDRRLAGDEPGQRDVDEFLERHGGFFPGAATLDDVVDQLADRMAAMQSLMRSLTPEQRAELQDTLEALLRDDRLAVDLARLASNMDRLLPEGLGEPVRFTGDQPLGLEPALAQLEQLAALDALESQLDGTTGAGELSGVDRQALRDLVGPESVRDLDVLDDLVRRLEDAGYLEQGGRRMELTPRATRRIGQKVLDELFTRLGRDAFGGHRRHGPGQGGEREEASRPYAFGDPFDLDLRATLDNALLRPENAPGTRDGPGLRIRAEDFEVFGTEQSTTAATILLVDMSRSMLLRGCYLAAKRVAIALDTLIRTQYPRDHLGIVGFAYYARELRPEALAELSWQGYEYGTNLQHGLLLARRMLAKQRVANKEIVVITDGEPTAHFENGQVEFNYPPTRRTITETLREVVRCTKEGITINTFMLEQNPALTDFIGLVTEINRGRAFYAEPENLGEYVLVDFVQRRTSRRRP